MEEPPENVEEDKPVEVTEGDGDSISAEHVQLSPRACIRRRTVGMKRPLSETELLLSGPSSRLQLDEERLKWQMEMANIRHMCSRVEMERDELQRERSLLEERVACVERECESLQHQVHEKSSDQQEKDLKEARQR